LLDWDDVDAAWANGTDQLIDAVLVESAEHTVRTLHRFSTRCAARGSVSVSVVGLLQPASLVSGALAGGVGEQTIATLAGAIDRDRIKQLGDTMDRGEFTIIVITGDPATGDARAGDARPGDAGPDDRRPVGPDRRRSAGGTLRRSIASITVPVSTSTEAIGRAVESDDPLR
jgi:hypothetical protein